MFFKLPKLNTEKNIYIFGCGIMALSYKIKIEQLGLTKLLKGFLETTKTKDTFLNHKVYHPKDIPNEPNTQILIATNKHSDSVYKQLIESGFKDTSLIMPPQATYTSNWHAYIFDRRNIENLLIYPPISDNNQLTHLLKKLNSNNGFISNKENYKITVTLPFYKEKNLQPIYKKTTFSSIRVKPLEINKKNCILTFHQADRIIIWNAPSINDIPTEFWLKSRIIDITTLPKNTHQIKERDLYKNNVQIQKRLDSLIKKETIKIVFLINQIAIWRLDSVIKKLLIDKKFTPLIVITPFIHYGEKRMIADLARCISFFEAKNLPFVSSYNIKEGTWLTLNELAPDIVVISDPHKTTHSEYYENAYTNYLTCYVPYAFDAATDFDTNVAYNKPIHNLAWTIFSTSAFSIARSKKFSSNKGLNNILTGSFTCEELTTKSSKSNPWKEQENRKLKIIYSPHQSIEENSRLNLSTFLIVSEEMQKLAILFKDQVQWAFKPHPFLKEKLYRHPDWGKEKTNQYYRFWQDSSFTQFEDGSYTELFKTSDALIHDCGSFLFEYLVTRKPCAFLELNSDKQLISINEFGKESLECHTRIKKPEDIKLFIEGLIKKSHTLNTNYKNLINSEIIPLYYNSSPSTKVVEYLKASVSQSLNSRIVKQ